MKIAIHKQNGGFYDRWIEYCKNNNITYKIVNTYDSDIVMQLEDCDAFMWDYDHADYRDILFGKQLLYSIQTTGKKVFPDFSTGWHFNDKVGQKYLLEAINAPFVPTYIFYTEKEALKWLKNTKFPKVFKLRGGAGSANVKLAKTKEEALRLIKKSFKQGFKQFNPKTYFLERWNKYKDGKIGIKGIIYALSRFTIPPQFSKMAGKEKGYVYFQDFIPNNSYDIRIIVIGDKAFAIKRIIRDGDFRASGSGNIVYKRSEIDERCIKIAFEINNKIQSQCIAYDFVFDKNNSPLILEISYGFNAKGYDSCEGYWDNKLQWHEGKFNPYGWMIENLLKSINVS